MADWQEISGGVTAPRGYQAAGITAGLKPSGLPDLALIWSDVEAIAAGVFTTSQVKAACVDYCRQRLQAKHSARAILCNAGQANASTGMQGLRDTEETAEILARELNISPESILLASTGVIGQRIKMDALRSGIPKVVAALSETGSDAAAGAIITTDLVTKSIALETTIGDASGGLRQRPVRIGGISKGSGMIHPNMATMLAFVTCDAAVSSHLWQQMLSRAADQSFNAITVDGDTSTNDSLIALANGQSRTPAITEMGAEAEKLEAMLTAVCQHLAKAIARDGEGATCLIEVQVTGAYDQASARQIAKTVAGSSLVKSAIFGRDPNWGRIAAAAGRAGVNFEQDNLQIKLGDFLLLENGQPVPFDRAAASAYLKQIAADSSVVANGMTKGQRVDNPVIIAVNVGNGHGFGKAWGCDLSYDYVKINAEYTT
ncbi:bifunctional ornithine acetyltransferase/N-acetylglutamate synthase [Nodularia spumigena CS-584]|jgi:glutamate N-acetyltransferase / amino-acid N-acetyltransferase|uniref:Arginine biosynthesis bifunctional protein ArgJ n=2 Tax=Nodularia spumigena TaxID=70799 RepID=A0ABU5UR10_NODSP|nr:bifunctional ornithine acetyltransferase/N-acetylglutamate synthase [Nodularia spumigena]AHJ28012.1 Glutamate N-acetyltransferase / N-acetylglutamate synthase [Nodularia spumigena CCY9414]MDB9382458.1 bifunctional ornithine acetyltransferase/N-acetylglutamate synthase [Nodularia spumigena CS-584]MEA5523874.1 bifunctional ornithine acetyltransferase/N-acetylglutamate synthase [Nodularia spumigena UHCC 0143]MEA5555841.1 bifunctional ornithine acetyltransferase/N-acetylglutamate synthase [Nodul